MTVPEQHPLRHPELPAGIDPPPPPSPRERERAGLPAWPVWAPLAAFLAAVVAALLASVVITAGVQLAGEDVDVGSMPPGVTIGATVVQALGFIGFAVLFAHVTAGRARPADFGFRRTPVGSAIGFTALAWVSFLILSGIWAAALGLEQSDDLPQELGADESTVALVAVLLMVTLVAPVAEELFFRGFLFTTLRRWLGLIPGALITGVVFGGIHAGGTDAEFLVPLMIFGVILCLLYWRTDSLLPPMALHALNNALAFGVTMGWPAWAVVLTMAGACGLIVAGALAISARRPAAAPPRPAAS
jgi:hypothetical protein